MKPQLGPKRGVLHRKECGDMRLPLLNSRYFCGLLIFAIFVGLS